MGLLRGKNYKVRISSIDSVSACVKFRCKSGEVDGQIVPFVDIDRNQKKSLNLPKITNALDILVLEDRS